MGPASPEPWPLRALIHVHVTPDQAMQLFATLGAEWMVPMHYATFAPPDDEVPKVRAAVARSPLAARVRVLGVGETAEFLY